ncbi:hypothetical protein ABW99_04015 [Pandoraea thiooxydans]|uniref:Uncharacterized protein n=1 Tax=Pandoraea thiooxydans TaxID=445709 RepID=A0A0G3ENF5_9BURK|nr:hypothetical protein [Pandoraea thiooxydans]AKJ67519.1 hypothetical protein ABW99_04015 [Pandoraea thiooxydans]
MKRTGQAIAVDRALAQLGAKVRAAVKVRMRPAIRRAPEHQPTPEALDAQWLATEFAALQNGIPVLTGDEHRGQRSCR